MKKIISSCSSKDDEAVSLVSDDESVMYKEPSKVLSIYYLHRYMLEKRTGVSSSSPDQIDALVKQYNNGKDSLYKPLTLGFLPEKNHGFSLLAYECVSRYQSAESMFLGSLGAKTESSTKVSYLMVFFKNKHVFAVPTGNAYQVLMSVCDMTFPLKVAARLLDPDKVVGGSKYNLFGPITTQLAVNRQEQQISEMAKGAQVKLFTTSFKSNSSVFALGLFEPKRNPSVDVGFRYLRSHSKLDFSTLPRLLAHFSTIMQGDETFTYSSDSAISSTKEEDDDQFKELRRLQIKDSELLKQLTSSFSGYLLHFKSRPTLRESIISSIVIAPEAEHSYMKASSYGYQCYDEDEQEFDSKPQLTDFFKLYDELGDGQDLLTWLKSMTLVFEHGTKMTSSFYDALRGEITCKGCQYYFLGGRFYPADELRLDVRFQVLLSRSLVSNGDLAQLEAWPVSLNEGPYNEAFLEQYYDPTKHDVGNLVGDRILVEKCELFDIIRVTPDYVYLFAVKEGLNAGSARAVCGQIREAATRFRANREDMLNELWERFCKGSPEEDEDTKSVDGAASQQYRADVKMKSEALGQDSFLEIFEHRQLVFVAAMAQKPEKKDVGGTKTYHVPKSKSFFSCVEDVTLEQLPDFYDAFLEWVKNALPDDDSDVSDTNIQACLDGTEVDPSTRRQVADSVHALQADFITAYVDDLDEEDAFKDEFKKSLIEHLKPYTFCTSGRNKRFFRPQSHMMTFFTRSLKAVQSQTVNSNNLKLELLSLEETLKDFGFLFKICQIERTDKPSVSFLPLPPKGSSVKLVRNFFDQLAVLPRSKAKKKTKTKPIKNEVKPERLVLNRSRFNCTDNRGGGDCLFYALENKALSLAELRILREQVSEQLPEIRAENRALNALALAQLLQQSFGSEGCGYMQGVHEVSNAIYQDYQKMCGMYAGDDELMQYCKLKDCTVLVVEYNGIISEHTSDSRTEVQSETEQENIDRIQAALTAGVRVLYKSPNHFVRIESIR